MKLYDGGRAPNPRRVRIFLAEKGITVPIEQVDLGKLAAEDQPAYTAINPVQRVPALVLDDGTVIAESIAICRYFEALHPEPAAVRRGRQGDRRWSKCGSGGSNSICSLPISQVFRNTHPAMKEMEVPQVPAWAEANKPRVHGISGHPRPRAARTGRFVAGDRYTVADITGLVRGRFHEAGQARGAGDLCERAALACRGVGAAERERLTMRLTIVGCGDAFGSGGRFNTCFWLETAKATPDARLRRVLAGGAARAAGSNSAASTA